MYTLFISFLFFFGAEDRTEGLALARQALWHWAKSPTPTLFISGAHCGQIMALAPLELEWQLVVDHLVGSENQTWVLCKGSKCSLLLSHFYNPFSFFFLLSLSPSLSLSFLLLFCLLSACLSNLSISHLPIYLFMSSVCVGMLVHSQMSGGDTGHPAVTVTYFLYTGSLTEPGARLAVSHQASGIFMLLSLTALGSQALLASPGFYMGAGYLNSGPHARTASGLSHLPSSSKSFIWSLCLPSRANLYFVSVSLFNSRCPGTGCVDQASLKLRDLPPLRYILILLAFCCFCFVLLCFCSWYRISLCNPGCPGTGSVDQASLKLRDLPPLRYILILLAFCCFCFVLLCFCSW